MDYINTLPPVFYLQSEGSQRLLIRPLQHQELTEALKINILVFVSQNWFNVFLACFDCSIIDLFFLCEVFCSYKHRPRAVTALMFRE